ncbi:hypothetical protein Bbelb_431070 [Branchiostoma belcheri]|nr:hypothetical protein Bbelb_431070 [Branchiostoma belcheri]
MLHAILKDKRKFACTCDWHTANLSDTGLLKYARDSGNVWALQPQREERKTAVLLCLGKIPKGTVQSKLQPSLFGPIRNRRGITDISGEPTRCGHMGHVWAGFLHNRKRRQERANVLTPRVLMAASEDLTDIPCLYTRSAGWNPTDCCLRNQWVFGAALLDRDLSYDSANWGGGAEPPAVCVSAGEGDCPVKTFLDIV